MKTRAPATLAWLLLAGLAGCGGGGGGLATSSQSLPAVLDGFVTDDGFVDTATSSAIAVGDTDGTFDNHARGFVRFDRSNLPPGATIVSATLRLHQSAVVGSPYATHGDVVVDHVDVGTSLDAGDFGALPLIPALGVLSDDAGIESKDVDVTAAVLADVLAGRITSDFRLYFPLASDSDGAEDYVQFNDVEDHFGDDVPLLEIEYLP
jgi:hypothetical protein